MHAQQTRSICWNSTFSTSEYFKLLEGLLPDHVVEGPEHPDFVVVSSVGLHTLEKLLGVVQDFGCWMHLEGHERPDRGSFPSSIAGPLDFEHVVGEVLAETQVIGRRFGSKLRRGNELDL